MAIAGVAGLVAVLGGVGLGLPQIATKSEVAKVAGDNAAALERLAGDVKSIRQQMLNSQIESYELRRLRLEREAKIRKDKGEESEAIGTEIRILKRRTRSIQLQLDKLQRQ